MSQGSLSIFHFQLSILYISYIISHPAGCGQCFRQKYTKKPHHVSVVRFLFLLQAKTLVEAINTSTGVNQLLLAGIERVALGADLNTDLLLSGAGSKDVTTVAADGGLFVLGMDTFLHFIHLFLIK